MMEKKFPAINPKVEFAAVSEGLGPDLHRFDIWFSLLHLLQIFLPFSRIVVVSMLGATTVTTGLLLKLI